MRGRVVPVDDRELRAATADTVEAVSGWRPPDHWHVSSLEIEDAAYMAWDKGRMTMDRWTPERGIERVEKTIEL